MNLAVVVQRYGADINGGAELHARFLAERLSRHASVRVLTTCARDYVTWRNDMPAGTDVVNGIPVERFAVDHERDEFDFARRSAHVFTQMHSLDDELKWLESEGPACEALVRRVEQAQETFDFVLVFSVRYYQAYHCTRAASERVVLVPTAERDPALGLAMFQPVFRGVRAVMYNSHEERALINAVAGNQDVPGTVVGIGSEIPADVDAERARHKFDLRDPYLVYVGRIDANKGCAELFDYFIRYRQITSRPLDLVLIGTPVMDIPSHQRIRHLGFVSEQDKFDVIAGAEALVMPSYFESLSMVALEAWALGRPVIANARCDVLVGQCLRSDAGLYYENGAEFAGAVDRLIDDVALARALGRNGRDYYRRNYDWPVVEHKYLEMFARLKAEPGGNAMEPLPGWLERRKRQHRPAADVVAGLPAGPAVPAADGALA